MGNEELVLGSDSVPATGPRHDNYRTTPSGAAPVSLTGPPSLHGAAVLNMRGIHAAD